MNLPWHFAKSLSHTREYLLQTEVDIKAYDRDSYLINKILSFHMDCVLYVNEVNLRAATMLPQAQYDFLFYSIRKRNRNLKWVKGEKNDYVPFVQEYFGYNRRKAEEACDVLTIPQLEKIKEGVGL